VLIGRTAGFIDAHRRNPDAKVRVLLSIEGEDAKRVQRVSAAHGETPTELIAEQLRDADPSAAEPASPSRRPRSHAKGQAKPMPGLGQPCGGAG
jgi:hypothetical protein